MLPHGAVVMVNPGRRIDRGATFLVFFVERKSEPKAGLARKGRSWNRRRRFLRMVSGSGGDARCGRTDLAGSVHWRERIPGGKHGVLAAHCASSLHGRCSDRVEVGPSGACRAEYLT